MRPLIARKAARGLSESRRPAMSMAGLLARLAMTRAPAIISHGPAIISPVMSRRNPRKNATAWPPVVPGCPTTAK